MTKSAALLQKIPGNTSNSSSSSVLQSRPGTTKSSSLLQSFQSGTLKLTPYASPQSTAQVEQIVGGAKKQNPTFFEKLSGIVKNQKESLIVGIKNTKSQLQSSAGMLLENAALTFNKYDRQQLEKAKKKDPNSKMVEFLETKIKRQTEAFKVDKISAKAKEIKEAALMSSRDAKAYAAANIDIENPKNFTEAISSPEWIASQVVQNTPSMLASLGVGVLTAAITKNPVLGAAVGFAGSQAQNSGEAYFDAREFGLDDKQAQNIAMIAGTGMAMLDVLPIGRILNRTPQGQIIRKQAFKEISKSIIKQGVLEGGTESLQEIVANVAAMTYDETKRNFPGLIAGIPESFLIGGIMGGVTGGVADAVSGAIGQNQDTAAVTQSTQMIETIKAKDPAMQTPEEKELLETVERVQKGEVIFDKVETVNEKVGKYKTAEEFARGEFGVSKDASFGTIDPQEVSFSGQVNGMKSQEYITAFTKKEDIEPVKVTLQDGELTTTEGYKVAAYKVLGTQMPVVLDSGVYPNLSPIEKIYEQAVKTSQEQAIALKKSKGEAYEYTPSDKLSKEEQVIEKKFGKQLTDDPDTAMKTYRKKFGKVLNTDNVRELSEDYEKNRSLYSPAVHEPSSALTKYMYKQMLKEKDPSGEDLVTFTGGGTGAGKTTAISGLEAMKVLVEKSQLVYDNNMNKFDSSVEKIDLALKAGKRAGIMYVYADPVQAFKQAVGRANRMGRTVPIREHLATHIGAFETIFKLAKHYEGNEDVHIEVIDNSLGKGEAIVSSLENIKDKKYDKEAIERQANEYLTAEYEAGRISADIYQGFSGKKPDSVKDVDAADGARSSGQLKQERAEGEPEKVNKVKVVEEVASSNVPVGEGKQRNSRLQERIQEQLLEVDQGKYEFDEKTGKYNRLSLEDDAGKALDFLTENPQDALKVAYGMRSAPQGQTANAISLAVAFKAREEGNFTVYTDVINRLTLRATRMGQEIVSLRGQFNQNTPENFVRQVLARRLANLGNSVVTEAKELVGKMNLAREKAITKIDEQTKRINKVITRERTKMQLAQNIIEALKCK